MRCWANDTFSYFAQCVVFIVCY